MSYLTAAQFIETYNRNPSEALQLLDNHQVATPTLDEITRLGRLVEAKCAPLWGKPAPEIINKYQIITAPIAKWFKQPSCQAAALIKNYDQYMELINTSSIIAAELFEQDADRMAGLFTTFEQFMTLKSKSNSLATKIFEQHKDKIAGLFTTFKQFMTLESKSNSLATKIFEQHKDKIAGLFTTFEQFMTLESKSNSLATKIFEQDPDKIAGLFITHKQFMTLTSSSSSLAQKISAQHPDRIAAIRNNKDTPPPMPTYKTTAPRQSSFPYSSPSLFSQTTKPVNKPKVEKEYSPQPASDIDYSFYLKCLGCLAVLAGGALLVVTGLMIASQPLALLGGVIAVAGGISLYELCSAKDDKKQDDVASQRAWSLV